MNNNNNKIKKLNNSITFIVEENILKNDIKFKDFSIDLLMGDLEICPKYDDEFNIINQDEIDRVNEINKREKIILNSSLSTKNDNNQHVINDSNKYIGSNSFIYSAIKAYSDHHHLIIRPDDIWMSILVQFSTYINKYSDQLSNKFVKDFQGTKKMLTVETNYPILIAPHDKLTVLMVDEIKKNIVDPSIVDWLIPTFTTTTPTDHVVYSATLMSTVKSFFDFKCFTRCGLPSVTLFGTIDDWIQIKEKIEKLKEFDILDDGDDQENNDDEILKNNKQGLMSEWVSLLHPVLDQFITTVSGNPNIDWWKLIAKENNISGGPVISGWITVFCPFNIKSECIFDTKYYWTTVKEQRKINNNNSWLRISWSHILNGYVSVPLILQEANGVIYNSTLFAGHLTIKNDKDDDLKSIKPSLDWLLLIDK